MVDTLQMMGIRYRSGQAKDTPEIQLNRVYYFHTENKSGLRYSISLVMGSVGGGSA